MTSWVTPFHSRTIRVPAWNLRLASLLSRRLGSRLRSTSCECRVILGLPLPGVFLDAGRPAPGASEQDLAPERVRGRYVPPWIRGAVGGRLRSFLNQSGYVWLSKLPTSPR